MSKRCAECGRYGEHASLCPYANEMREDETGADLPEDDPRDFLFDELREENLL